MRVLYDISTLGLAHLYAQSRGGPYRVELHIGEGLAASRACELLFCANHSTVAYHGCERFLRTHGRLRAVPLVAAAGTEGRHKALRATASAAHRRIRQLFGSNVLPSSLRRIARLVDKRLHPPVCDPGSGVDILHSSPMAPLPSYVKRGRPKRLLTIYDLAAIRFPGIYGPPHRRSLEQALRSVGPEDHVITNTNYVREEIMAEGIVSPDRIHVVPLAADPTLFYRCADQERITAVRRKYGIPEGPYILGVNTPDDRKNVPHAVHAFARACHERAGVLASFVLTGHPGVRRDEVSEAIAAHPELRGRIILTGYVPDEDLAPLYSDAGIFVYVSLYEGFGLPPLEAMQCGAPVITSNTSSLPEVVGAGGVMVPPDDLDALAAAILGLATDADRCDRLRKRALAQAGSFTWDRSTAATLHAYRTALAG